ncbi:MAG: DNA-directed polymerase [Fibrobacteres bacterium]|nr:DNA-directed polymerase [Fibrobacterota bacterium]
MKFSFTRTQGLEEAKAFLTQALSSGKFPHGLLVHGPEGVGQNALLLDLVDILLCDAADIRPCGACAGCLGRQRNNLDSLIFLMPIEKKDKSQDKAGGDGEMEDAQVDELTDKAKEFHQDPYGFTRTEKSNLNVGQIRSMQARLSFAEVSRKPRIVVILWAETMGAPAANTLLKTLEEPPPNTYFLLSSDDRSVLLPTIISRCTQLPLFSMGPDALRAALAAKGKVWDIETPPERLIPFAEGSLGVLLHLHRNAGETLLEESGRYLAAALGGDWLAYSDYLEESDAFGDMQSASRLLHFLLRVVRMFHRLEALEGPVSRGAASASGFSWTREALKRQGLDPALSEIIGPLEGSRDLTAFTALIEETLSAVQSYAKPKVAALGLYLDFASKHPRKESLAC